MILMETENHRFQLTSNQLDDEDIYDRIIEALKDEIHKKLLEEWVELENRVNKLNKSCA